jgi:hypothetical protein
MGEFLESFVWSSMDHSKDNFKIIILVSSLTTSKKIIITIPHVFKQLPPFYNYFALFPYPPTWI